MSHLPTIITDLALLLSVAGLTTIIFKKLNQPLVLGYIVAGFLTGPNFAFFPTLADSVNISTWSEIGVIFLMFALGLEFSFYKLKSVGSTAFIATAIAVGGMIIVGYICGGILGWSHMDSLFLGGMLSMSSTAIIVKAFDEMGLKEEKFAGLVFGVLIIEDIAGIVMMVMLSTLAAATSNVSPLELLQGIGKLVFCLVLWFVLGMYLVPSFFKKTKDLMNDETLVVFSSGLCLVMVYIASYMGFSSALGAFIMGSLIAESPFAERIEHLVNPIKNLFGAVFFVSVGMLVNPTLLLKYWAPVIFLIIVTVVGQVSLAIIGMLASGQDLKTSVRCGFSLCQIGEFSFIIASLGESLKVIDDFLYPIIVAVSVITTFTTPFCIKAALPAYEKLEAVLPARVKRIIDRYTKSSKNNYSDNNWQALLQQYLTQMVIFATLLLALGIAAEVYLLPYLENTLELPYSNLLTAGAAFLTMAPLLAGLLNGSGKQKDYFTALWIKSRLNHPPLLVLLAGKILVSGMSLYFIFHTLVGLHGLAALAAPLMVTYGIFKSDWLMNHYLNIETSFLINLNEKHMKEHRELHGDADGKWFDEDLHMASFVLQPGSPLANLAMMQTSLKSDYGCNIIQIKDKHKVVDFPGGQQIIPAESKLLLLGTKLQLESLLKASSDKEVCLANKLPPFTLREYMLNKDTLPKEEQFVSFAVEIDDYGELIGKTMKEINFRDEYNCMVIGIERGAYTITNPHVSLTFEKGDLLWILGKEAMVGKLVKHQVL